MPFWTNLVFCSISSPMLLRTGPKSDSTFTLAAQAKRLRLKVGCLNFAPAQVPRVLFTGLEDFKIRGSQASPYLVATHYDDLAESKDIVLVRGDIILPAHLSDDEVWLTCGRDFRSFLKPPPFFDCIQDTASAF